MKSGDNGIKANPPTIHNELEKGVEYDGKKFSSITKENIKFGDEDNDSQKRILAAYHDKFKKLTKFINKLYGSAVMSTKVHTGLVEFLILQVPAHMGTMQT